MLVDLFLLLFFGKSPSDASRVGSLPCSQLHFLQLKCFCERSQLLSAALAAFLIHLCQIGQDTPLRLTSVAAALLPWSVGLRPVGAAAVCFSQGCIESLPELPHSHYRVPDCSDLLVCPYGEVELGYVFWL